MLEALFIKPMLLIARSHLVCLLFLMLPFFPGIWVVTTALTAFEKSPFPVVSTIAVRGYLFISDYIPGNKENYIHTPAPSEVTIWKVPEIDALSVLICGSVLPERAIDLVTPDSALFLPAAFGLLIDSCHTGFGVRLIPLFVRNCYYQCRIP